MFNRKERIVAGMIFLLSVAIPAYYSRGSETENKMPPLNESLRLVNPSIGTETCLAEKMAYTFQVNVTDQDGADNLMFIDLILDPVGSAVTIRWNKSDESFTETSDINDMIELGNCTKEISQERVTLGFSVVFHWNYVNTNAHPIRVFSTDDHGLSDIDEFMNIYYVVSEIVVDSASVTNNVALEMNQNITFTGRIFYNGTTIPPSAGHLVAIMLGGELKGATTTNSEGHFNVTIGAGDPSLGYGVYNYTVTAEHAISNRSVLVAVQPPPEWSIKGVLIVAATCAMALGVIILVKKAITTFEERIEKTTAKRAYLEG